jgi:hypothetical protein
LGISGILQTGPRPDILPQLFCSRPTPEIFHRSWRTDAVFEDPFTKCVGYREYAAKWYSMSHQLRKSRISHHVISSTYNPDRITYQQEQEYTVHGLGTKKVKRSLVVIELDEQDKIIHLHDMWDGDENPTKWGALGFRRLHGMILPWLVSVPKDEMHK